MFVIPAAQRIKLWLLRRWEKFKNDRMHIVPDMARQLVTQTKERQQSQSSRIQSTMQGKVEQA